MSLEDNRLAVQCNANKNGFVKFMCIYDTGARYTTIPANVIAPELNENDLGDAEQKKLGGFIKGDYIKFYKYSIDNLAVGNIILGPQDVWITFDEKIGATLLGMDIIKAAYMSNRSLSQVISADYFRRKRLSQSAVDDADAHYIG